MSLITVIFFFWNIGPDQGSNQQPLDLDTYVVPIVLSVHAALTYISLYLRVWYFDQNCKLFYLGWTWVKEDMTYKWKFSITVFSIA